MKRKAMYILASAVVAIVGVAVFVPLIGHRARASQTEPTASVQPVAVVLVQRKPISNSLVLSGEFVPFQQVDVHAKVAGYIRNIYVDVGDHVKAGQTLAVLEVPELSAQLQAAQAAVQRARDAIRRAQGDLVRAQSLHGAAHLDYTRMVEASKDRPGLIAEQELDDAQAKDKESEAQISVEEAALSEAKSQLDVAVAQHAQYAAISDYTRIVAPFNGVVTKRYVDAGSLVQAGTSSNTQALPVVQVAQNDLFRLTLPIPESAVPMIRVGDAVKVHVSALNRDFTGRVSRFADLLNEATRTMHTEVDVPNRGHNLVPGMFADVTLTLQHRNAVLTVPIQAVERNGTQASVLVVNPQHRIEERKITLGLEAANDVEVTSGVSENDEVVIGSRAEFHPGDLVAPKRVAESQQD